jgi:hypothetical protein
MEKREDGAWISKERARCREKQKKRYQLGLCNHDQQSKRNWALRNREKKRAQNIANNALRKGKIQVKTECESCGRSNTTLHKHHTDYAKPLEVIWLCPSCHGLTWRKKV